MTERSDVQTPSEQTQHQPPSLPTSPHPKRVKTDDLLNPAPTPTSTNTITLPTMSAPSQTPIDLSSPTPTSATTSGPGSTLPAISSLLPTNITNGHTVPLPQQQGSSSALPLPIPTQVIPPLLIQKLSEDALPPTRGSAFAAGYDIYASSPCTLKSKSKALVSTGIAMAVPPGTYGRIAPRSGLASKHFLDVGAGVIDADYRGEVKVLMFNFSDVDYEVKKGERVAQLVLERILTPEVLVVDKLEESVRGVGGFGSTGYI